jgi:hypothetical protein
MKFLSIVVISILISALSVQADTVTVPNDAPAGSGRGFADFSGGISSRYQEVFSASQFQAAGGPISITQFAWREGRAGSSLDMIIPSPEISMSTTFKTPQTISVPLDGNIGPDSTVVFPTDSLHIVASVNANGPSPFDIKFPLKQPFSYDPSKGDLLIEFRMSSPAGGPSVAFGRLDDSAGTVNFAGYADQPPGGVGFFAPITQFTYQSIPEPTSLTLLTVSGVSVLLILTIKERIL